jgi:hypothetical protein
MHGAARGSPEVTGRRDFLAANGMRPRAAMTRNNNATNNLAVLREVLI